MCRFNKLNSRKSWDCDGCQDPDCKPMVMHSLMGYYIGTTTKEGFPNCRITGYWIEFEEAKTYLDKYSGDPEESTDNEEEVPEVESEDEDGEEKRSESVQESEEEAEESQADQD